MFNAILTFAIAVYRANPLRRHCNAAAGRHVWLCSLLGLPVGGTDFSDRNPCKATSLYEGNTRCPLKDA